MLVKWCFPKENTMNIYQQNTHAHSVGWNTWHLEWCTKYRYKMFRQEYIKNFGLICISEAAKRHGIEIIEIEVDADHVHVIANLPMTMPPTRALNLIKGLSAHLLFKLIPNLKRRYPKGSLWSPGKFAASIGHITLDKAKKYLEDHHAKSILRESPLRSISEGGSPKREPLGRGRMSTSSSTQHQIFS